MTDPWIPYEGEPAAFTVQRSIFGDVAGGDYVRGGSAGLAKAATRYRVEEPSTQELATQTTLVSFVRSYSTIELTWGWPTKYNNWLEIALVRSGFGHPSTVNDGVTIYRSTRAEFLAVDADNVPLSILVVDDDLPSGHFFYYTLFFFAGDAWVPALHTSALLPRPWGHQDHLWNSLPPYYQWVDARFRSNNGHLRQFLNSFGFELDLTREYIESWQEVYHTDMSPVPLLRRVGENLGLNYEAGLGEIRYRALVGQLSQLYERRGTPEGIRRLIEVSSKYETSLTVGRNMMLLPDDSEFATGQGNWVLGPVGGSGATTNTTTGAAAGSGAANAATVSINAITILAEAATASGEGLGQSSMVSGPAGVTGSSGSMVVSAGVGSGAAFAASVSYPIIIQAPYLTDDRSPGYGRGVMNVNIPVEVGTGDVTVLAGVGELFIPPMREPRTLSPKFHGIPVRQGSLYGFSVQFKSHSTGVAGIRWYSRNEVLLGTTELLTPVPGVWQTLTVQDSPPVGAAYAVPSVRATVRTAGDDFMLMGAMFYRVGEVGSVTAHTPDFYLTLGSLDELLGVGGPVMGDA